MITHMLSSFLPQGLSTYCSFNLTLFLWFLHSWYL